MFKVVLGFIGAIILASMAKAEVQPAAGNCIWRPGIVRIFATSSNTLGVVASEGQFDVQAMSCWNLMSVRQLRIESFGSQVCPGDRIVTERETCFISNITRR